MKLSEATFCMVDHGLYSYLAEALGKACGKGYYFVWNEDPYPGSPKARIGEGFENVERIDKDKFEELKEGDKIDLWVFPDVYDGALQETLRKRGNAVFGSGKSEILELDKKLFYTVLQKLNLPVPPTKKIDGMNNLWEYLEGKEDKFIKTSYYRGDFETYHWRDKYHAKSWYRDAVSRLGSGADDIELLIQSHIRDACEWGYDGFNLNGQYTSGFVGPEIKDEGYIGKFFEEPPDILRKVNDKLSDTFKKLGYQGAYSTELRITEDGKPYFIDATCRVPSPPGEALMEGLDYPKAIWDIANWNPQDPVPEIKPKAKYCAEVILQSPWHEAHEIYVEIPKEIEQWVKVKNAQKVNGRYFCIPNGNAGIFGSVVAIGNSLKSVMKDCMEMAHMVKADQIDIETGVFDEADKQIEEGAKHGIEFG